MKTFVIKTATAEYEFTPECGGFPRKATVIEPDSRRFTAWELAGSGFSVKTKDQTVYHPVCGADTPVNRYKNDGAQVVEFSRIPWKNSRGKDLDHIYLSLKWEFFPDGTVFCDMFLFYASLDVTTLKDFKLALPLDFSDFDDVKWSVRLHPKKVDATIIQAAPPERFLPRTESRSFPQSLFAQANFNAMRKKGPSFFAEFLLEGNNSLFNYDLKDTASAVTRTGKGFEVEWNFQTKPAGGTSFPPLHWRNRIGFLLRPAPVRRNLPPMHICHYIDNFDRFPTDAQIKAIAGSGAKILMLHDCWRFDTQNGGIPYNEGKFRHGVALAHKYGLRVVPYVRGNEISVREDAASWFDAYLIKDFDGLYMDYGGPFGYAVAGDENFPGGRIAFREYYKAMRSLRERVGKNGVFYSHTGTGYSGIASSFFDGYVSGEGERGILIKGRREHEYFSMSAVSPGSMWTAAFPEYSSRRMIPFLAAAAQPPHIPLGKQIESSSLRHPPVPGISDKEFSELLYIWSLSGCGSEHGLTYYTDYNSRGIFAGSDSPETAHTLILTPNGQYGVMTLANCSGMEKDVKASFKLNGAFAKYTAYAIPGQKAPSEVRTLAPHEVVGAIVALKEETARKLLKQNPRPVMKPSAKMKKYLKFVEEQKALRTPDEASRRNELVIFIPTRVTSHERSLMADLYDVDFELRERLPDGTIKTFGWISKDGLVKKIPTGNKRLKPGDRSQKIDLAKVLGKGKHEVQVCSTHKGYSFCSFVIAEITTDRLHGAVEFINELETDRSILHWTVIVK